MPWTAEPYLKGVYRCESPTLADVTDPLTTAFVDDFKQAVADELATLGITVDSWNWRITVDDDTGGRVWVSRGG